MSVIVFGVFADAVQYGAALDGRGRRLHGHVLVEHVLEVEGARGRRLSIVVYDRMVVWHVGRLTGRGRKWIANAVAALGGRLQLRIVEHSLVIHDGLHDRRVL